MIRMFRGLEIVGQSSDLDELMSRIDSRADDHWHRERQIEGRAGRVTAAGQGFIFSVEPGPGRPAATLWLDRYGPNQIVATSIMAAERRALTVEEHDAILDDFEASVVRPSADGLAVNLRVIPAGIKLDRYLSSEASDALRSFSKKADRDVLSSSDWRAWKSFVIRAYLGGSLDAEDLDWWLKNEGWPESTRQALVDSYRSSRSLLAEYDEERVHS